MRLPGRWTRRFLGDRRGAVAVEFAIVSIPFFFLMVAILETTLVYFVGTIFESAVNQATRQVRTGAATAGDWDLADFREEVCRGTFGLFDCNDIYLRVAVFGTYSDITFTVPLDEDGEFTDPSAYATSAPLQIVAVTAYYRWPIIIDYFGATLANVGNGTRLLSATNVFRNEPFPP